MLYFLAPESGALLINMLTVGLGELVVCFAVGYPLTRLLKKYPKIFD